MTALDDISKFMPPSVMAAGMARACGEFVRTRPQLAYNILFNTFQDLIPLVTREVILRGPDAYRAAIAALLLGEYFETHGDWAAMERKIREGCPTDPALFEKALSFLMTSYREIAATASTSEVGDAR